VHPALFLVGKLIRRRTPFGSAAFSTHATATPMHFPANAGLMFLTDELTNDRYLVDVKPAPNHGVEHHIHTGSHPPIFAKSCRLDPEKLKISKVEFKRLESAGIVRRSKSPWASPLHMVPKKDGSWRPCGDYCSLNLVTTPDKYPSPNMQDLSNGLYGAQFFQKLILSRVITKFLSWMRTSQKLQS
jgi:hypothetical protein